MTQNGILSFLMMKITLLDSQSLMITWENIPLKDKSYIPKIYYCVKTVLLQHFLIVFNCSGKLSELIFTFDLNEKRWIRTKFYGDEYYLENDPSFCLYDNETIVMFGTSQNPKEDILGILSLNKGYHGKQR